jgi:hypothetical protein
LIQCFIPVPYEGISARFIVAGLQEAIQVPETILFVTINGRESNSAEVYINPGRALINRIFPEKSV